MRAYKIFGKYGKGESKARNNAPSPQLQNDHCFCVHFGALVLSTGVGVNYVSHWEATGELNKI